MKMKKVGILTLPLEGNYGGMLQAFALYEFLSKQGFDVVFLNNDFYKSTWKVCIWSIIERLPMQNLKGVRNAFLKKSRHAYSIETYLPNRSKLLRSEADFKTVAENEKFDAVVVGSDQVWRWHYIQDGYERYFLSFIKNPKTRKISYAASFGKSKWEAKEKVSEVSKLLSDFYAVSTRESDGVEICKQFNRTDCQQVLDPTLLISKTFYERFLLKRKSDPNRTNLVCYVLDNQALNLLVVEQIQHALGVNIVVNHLDSDLSVADWVTEFYYADFVVSDSFHGVVFSLIFNKPFVAIVNDVRGASRFHSLLKLFDLEDRLILGIAFSEDKVESIVRRKIDFDLVNAKIKKLQSVSSKFLIDSINN